MRDDYSIYDHALARDRAQAAAEVAHSQPFPFTLTARAENFLVGRRDLDDTIRRLQAYQEAGADVLYAPGLTTADELRAVVMMARARERRPDAVTATEALELGTLGGAQALGLDSEVGSLAAGKRADLTVVSLAGSSYLPWEDPAGAVVFGGSPDRVVATYVGGELRYERGGMDWQELTAAARSARRAMLAPPAVRPVAAPHA